MIKSDFAPGARVFCQNGGCGFLLKVIVDPHTQQVTRLIVQKGFLVTTACILPITLVKHTSHKRIQLAIPKEGLSAYPEYQPAIMRKTPSTSLYASTPPAPGNYQ